MAGSDSPPWVVLGCFAGVVLGALIGQLVGSLFAVFC
jgi:hypothetical protein